MTSDQYMWAHARDELVQTVVHMGFPEALGHEMAKQLGSPKAMDRMKAYLLYEKPATIELVVDEMLAICADIEAWREKKANEETNAQYNVMLNSRRFEE